MLAGRAVVSRSSAELSRLERRLALGAWRALFTGDLHAIVLGVDHVWTTLIVRVRFYERQRILKHADDSDV